MASDSNPKPRYAERTGTAAKLRQKPGLSRHHIVPREIEPEIYRYLWRRLRRRLSRGMI
jgi:hypothetical protein